MIITGLSIGGAETMLLKLLQTLDRDRFAPEVISLTNLGEVGPRIEALGIPVHALGMDRGKLNLKGFWTLIGHLRRSRPDVVHTWMYHADLLGGLAARMAGIRALAWGIHQSNLAPEFNKTSTLMVVKASALASRYLPRKIISCSDRAMRVHVTEGYCFSKMVLVPNGFDLTRFVPDSAARASVRSEMGLSSDAPLVGVVARDDPQKNHLGFVEAAAAVHRVIPWCHFILAGTGIDKDNASLNRAIEQVGLRDNMHLLGRRDDVPRLMASLDVLASPSHGEAFPSVLGEAMACAVPCVATDVGDSAAIVGHTGRVVPAGQMDELARQLVALLEMPEQYRQALGVKARERIQEHYELRSITQRYEEIYSQLQIER
nr:glycosyltransferase [Thauera aminoaromatica]